LSYKVKGDEKYNESLSYQEVIANIDGIGKQVFLAIWNKARIVYSENMRKQAALMCKCVVTLRA